MERFKIDFRQKRWLFLLLGVLTVAAIVVATFFTGLISLPTAATVSGSTASSVPKSKSTPPPLNPAGTNSSHCSSVGKLVDSYPIKSGSTKIAELDLYYNSSTGYNCVYTRSVGSAYGKTKFMRVSISVCSETKPGSKCHARSGSQYFAEDAGNFKYYAGPVGVNGRGHCILAYGYVNPSHSIFSTPNASHCG
ncbi:hypothetical protein [Ktedonospora formicarum]|uniref:Uncharacterized protein n=1 Tax=Ktedonospora formicarum TaxID=2778364 RepID=A0A8J3MSA9_9CHLR|nr:hypothetical protein [Ktedonospora formicarum]GHO45910.1 hypothetical protein KSX_40730 [Ktedonospora formicarum]